MRSQLQRRTNPYPWTWELPVAIGLVILLVLTLGIHLGRSVATGLSGAGWDLTMRREVLTSIPAILKGNADAGRNSPLAVPVNERTLYIAIGVVEIGLLALLVWVGVVWMRRWGPARMRGMADGNEVEQLLGVSRLRRNAHVIRPDLHRKSRRSR